MRNDDVASTITIVIVGRRNRKAHQYALADLFDIARTRPQIVVVQVIELIHQ